MGDTGQAPSVDGLTSDSTSVHESSIRSIESQCTAKQSAVDVLVPSDHSVHHSTQHEGQKYVFTYTKCQPRTVGVGMTNCKRALSHTRHLYVGTLLDGLSPAFLCQSVVAHKSSPIPLSNQIGVSDDLIKVVTPNNPSLMRHRFIPNITMMGPHSLILFKRKMNETSLQHFSNMKRANQISLLTGARLSPDHEIEKAIAERDIDWPSSYRTFNERHLFSENPVPDAIRFGPGYGDGRVPFSVLPAFSSEVIKAAYAQEPLMGLIDDFRRKFPTDVFSRGVLVLAALTYIWMKSLEARERSETFEKYKRSIGPPDTGMKDIGIFLGYFEFLLSRTEYTRLAFHPNALRFCDTACSTDELYKRPTFRGSVNRYEFLSAMRKLKKVVKIEPVCGYAPCDLEGSEIYPFKEGSLDKLEPFKPSDKSGFESHASAVSATIQLIGNVGNLGLSSYAHDPKAPCFKVLTKGKLEDWYTTVECKSLNLLDIERDTEASWSLSYPAWNKNYYIVDGQCKVDALSTSDRQAFRSENNDHGDAQDQIYHEMQRLSQPRSSWARTILQKINESRPITSKECRELHQHPIGRQLKWSFETGNVVLVNHVPERRMVNDARHVNKNKRKALDAGDKTEKRQRSNTGDHASDMYHKLKDLNRQLGESNEKLNQLTASVGELPALAQFTLDQRQGTADFLTQMEGRLVEDEVSYTIEDLDLTPTAIEGYDREEHFRKYGYIPISGVKELLQKLGVQIGTHVEWSNDSQLPRLLRKVRDEAKLDFRELFAKQGLEEGKHFEIGPDDKPSKVSKLKLHEQYDFRNLFRSMGLEENKHFHLTPDGNPSKVVKLNMIERCDFTKLLIGLGSNEGEDFKINEDIIPSQIGGACQRFSSDELKALSSISPHRFIVGGISRMPLALKTATESEYYIPSNDVLAALSVTWKYFHVAYLSVMGSLIDIMEHIHSNMNADLKISKEDSPTMETQFESFYGQVETKTLFGDDWASEFMKLADRARRIRRQGLQTIFNNLLPLADYMLILTLFGARFRAQFDSIDGLPSQHLLGEGMFSSSLFDKLWKMVVSLGDDSSQLELDTNQLENIRVKTAPRLLLNVLGLDEARVVLDEKQPIRQMVAPDVLRGILTKGSLGQKLLVSEEFDNILRDHSTKCLEQEGPYH